MADAGKTSKILRTRRFGAEDAPEPKSETPSGLLAGIVDDTFAIGRAAAAPTPETEARLRSNLATLYSMARAGTASRGGLRTVVFSAAAALGIPVGVLAIADQGQPQVAELAETRALATSNSARITKLEAEQAELEADQQDAERRARRVQGLTVRWLGDTQRKQCKALGQIAKAIDPKLELDCEAETLPPELVRLVADLDIEEATRP